MQSKVQAFLEILGMSTHRHNGGFILKRFVVLIALAIGLIGAKLETNVENLWIQGERCRCCFCTQLASCISMGYSPSVRSRLLNSGQILFFFFCVFMDVLRRSRGHKLAKQERGQYQAILAEQAWSIKDLLYGFRGKFSCEKRSVVNSRQDSSILHAGEPVRDLIHLARSQPYKNYCPRWVKTRVSPAYTCKECVKYNKNIGVVCESISI